MKFIRGQASDSPQNLSKLSLSPGLALLPYVRDKYFRRNACQPPPALSKEPLLCLALSSHSFLDCTIIDAATEYPLYRVNTSGTTTTISRSESLLSFVVTSTIKWPKIIPLKRTKARPEIVLVFMRGVPWHGGGSLLKPGFKKHRSRKFRLPNHNDPIRWKLHESLYWCTTSMLGVIATLDPRGSHPRLKIFEDLYKPHRPVYGRVSVMLLDYLVVTALLLVTDYHEWASVPNPDSFPHSDSEVGYRSPINPQSSEERPSWNASSLSVASTSLSGPPLQTPSAGYSSPMTHSLIDADSDSEGRESLSISMPWKGSLPSPVCEAYSPSVGPSSSQILHRSTSATRGISSPFKPQSYVAPNSQGTHRLPRAASDDLHESLVHSTPGSVSQSSHLISDVTNGDLPQNVPQVTHPLQVTEEREQNPYNYVTPCPIFVTNDMGGRRPLPHPPIPCLVKSPPAPSRELGSPSQTLLGRNLPPVPDESRQSPVTPDSASQSSTSQEDSSSQRPQTPGPTSAVHRHQQRITEDTTQWLSATTGNSSTPERTPEFLLRASVVEAPPPSYHSLRFSLGQGRRPVELSKPAREKV